jgi:hypothetical protein
MASLQRVPRCALLQEKSGEIYYELLQEPAASQVREHRSWMEEM